MASVSGSCAANSNVRYTAVITEVTETATSIANNTSTIRLSFSVYSSGSTSFSGHTRNTAGIVYINDSWAQRVNQYFPLPQGMAASGNGLSSGSVTYTVPHNSDGTGSISYYIGTATGADDYGGVNWYWNGAGNSAVETKVLTPIPRYTTVSQSLSELSETSVKVSWSAADTCDYVWYSLDGGSWTVASEAISATSGEYIISGLGESTSHTITTKVRRKDSQLNSETSSSSFSTYAYPKITSCPSFTIGNTFTVGYSNPLGRTNIRLGLYLGGNLIASTSQSGTSWAINSDSYSTNFYANIPTATAGTYTVILNYGAQSSGAGTFYANPSVCSPSISNPLYEDTNSSCISISGTSQTIVQNLSTPNYHATVAAKNSTTLKSASVSVNGNTYAATISGSTMSVQGGIITSSSNVVATYTVTDNRGYSSSITKTVTIAAHSDPRYAITVHRNHNYEASTTIKVDATYDVIGTNNVIISYVATSQTGTTQSGTLINQKEASANFDNTQSWNFVFTIEDSFHSKIQPTYTLGRGTTLTFYDSILDSVGIGMFPTKRDSLQVKGAVEMGKVTISINSGNWSSSTTTVDGKAYYTQTIQTTKIYADYPDIFLKPAGTLPTYAESIAYALLDDAYANLSTNKITFYAETKPTTTFSVVVVGAL